MTMLLVKKNSTRNNKLYQKRLEYLRLFSTSFFPDSEFKKFIKQTRV